VILNIRDLLCPPAAKKHGFNTFASTVQMTRHVSRPLMRHGMYKSRPSVALSFPRVTHLLA